MGNIWVKNNLGKGKKTGSKVGVILRIRDIHPKYDHMVCLKINPQIGLYLGKKI